MRPSILRETTTGWLITQRSQVRILSPLPAEMALGGDSGGRFHWFWEHFGNSCWRWTFALSRTPRLWWVDEGGSK
jgi:hypothetical protein